MPLTHNPAISNEHERIIELTIKQTGLTGASANLVRSLAYLMFSHGRMSAIEQQMSERSKAIYAGRF
jgi:hypothetical protein